LIKFRAPATDFRHSMLLKPTFFGFQRQSFSAVGALRLGAEGLDFGAELKMRRLKCPASGGPG